MVRIATTKEGGKMKVVVVYRNGEEKLRVLAEVKNGVLRSGKNILINNDLIKAPHTRESVCAAIKAGRITPEIEAMGMRIGENGNGLVCRWDADVQAEARAEAERQYNALPADVRAAREERQAIDALYAAAQRSEYATDDNQMIRSMAQRSEADRRLAAWRKQYPEAARDEQAAEFRRKADRQDELAAGALVYDCDGSFSREMQDERAAEFRTQAAEFRRKAAQLAEV